MGIMEMHPRYVEESTAQLGKQKGVPQRLTSYAKYYLDGKLKNKPTEHLSSMFERYDDIAYAPTQSVLQAWLRTVGIKVYCVPSILSSRSDNWTWVIDFYIDGIYNGRKQVGSIFDTYEIALEKGLVEALKMLKDK